VILNPQYATAVSASEPEKPRLAGSRTAISGLRYYSPSLGRFVNRDPSEEQGGLNLYAFCRNNGVNNWDRLGLDTKDVDGGNGFAWGGDQFTGSSELAGRGDRNAMGFVDGSFGDDGSFHTATAAERSAMALAFVNAQWSNFAGDALASFGAAFAAGLQVTAAGTASPPTTISTAFDSSNSVGSYRVVAPTVGVGGNSLKLVGSAGVSGTIGVMLGPAPGPFVTGSISIQAGIDVERPLNSFIGVNYAYSPMIGVGFATTASTTFSGGFDWGDTITTGPAPTSTTFHLEAGFQDGPTPYVTNAGIDVNRDGVAYGRPGQGVGVDLHVAGGVTRTNAFNVTAGDLINYMNLTYLGGKLPLVNTGKDGGTGKDSRRSTGGSHNN